MKTDTFALIRNLLNETTKLSLHYFQAPYKDLSLVDGSLRKHLSKGQEPYQELLHYIDTLSHDHYYFVKDPYQLNYVLFYPYDHNQDLITLGPYILDSITQDYWRDMLEEHPLSMMSMHQLKGYLHGVPLVESNLQIISILSTIMSYINPRKQPFTVQYHKFEGTIYEGQPSQGHQNFEVYASAVEQRYNLERKLEASIGCGNQETALKTLRQLNRAPYEPIVQHALRDYKLNLITANTLFRKAVEVNEIHLIHLHEIFSKYVHLIEQTTTLIALNKLYEKMVRDYCHLVQNRSTKQFSPLIRKALHHIELNLNRKIHLSELAHKIEVSVPHLSSQFKKEMGITLIQYTNQLKIETALKLLNTSTMSIQDIAAHVGIDDYNYFTKVFKKAVGATPSDYRKSLHSKG